MTRLGTIGAALLVDAVLGVSALRVAAAQTATIAEPPTFSSGRSGVLDVLMVAAPQKVVFTAPAVATTGWAYQVCQRPERGLECPPGTPGYYSGFRFELQPGDLLRIRLVNRLPELAAADVERIHDNPLLVLNPTNLHTHGLIVEALGNVASPSAPPVYDDFIFVSVFNPNNRKPAALDAGALAAHRHHHGDVIEDGFLDYRIQLPKNHPSGAYWMHPHLHGIALNQVSAGLAGIISIGSVGQYACRDRGCTQPVPDTAVRHLILKDMQVKPDGVALFQEDTDFCTRPASAGTTPAAAGDGACAGTGTYVNGNWFFTVNGQQFPTIPVASTGEVWRFQNASGSASYRLQLTDAGSGQPIAMQVLSVDGVSLHIPPGTPAAEAASIGGTRFKMRPCALPAGTPAAAFESIPVCVSDFVLMPSARAEVFVAPQSAPGASAILETTGYNTGFSGDDWPAIRLAKVVFPAQKSSSAPDALHLHGEARTSLQPNGAFAAAAPAAAAAADAAPVRPECKPLAAHHRRRIYFGNPTLPTAPNDPGNDQYGNPVFGVAYEEIEEVGGKWVAVPGTFVPLARFDPANVICLPLAPGNQTAHETWEIVNLTQELHNFHIHQVKFNVVDRSRPNATLAAIASNQVAGILEDNVPLPFISLNPSNNTYSDDHPPPGNSCPIEQTNLRDAGSPCIVYPVIVEIPFTKTGKFVFHCHILEHEDGGMMHAIEVVAARK
jgi:FtsP/CotA-like multicopper oxidase with cupredoxin domain